MHEKPFYEHFSQCRQPGRRVSTGPGNGGGKAGSGKKRQTGDNGVDERTPVTRCGAT